MKEHFIYNPLPKDNIQDFMHGVENALRTISNTMNTVDVHALPVLTVAPDYVFDGMLCVCDGTNWNPLSDGIKRAVIYLDGSWKGVS